MTNVPINMSVWSRIGNAIGMLVIMPSRIPWSHHDIRKALIPMVNPNSVRPNRMDSLRPVDIGAAGSGFELASDIQINPQMRPQIVAIMTRLLVNIVITSFDNIVLIL